VFRKSTRLKVILSNSFSLVLRNLPQDKQVQWMALCKRMGRERTPAEFVWMVAAIQEFLASLVAALLSDLQPPSRWVAGGAWSG
jgi:hypothetical protein